MAEIKVTSDDLRNVSSQLSSGSTEITTRMSSMRSLVEGVVSGGWQGAGSQSFNDLYQQWNTAGTQLQEALTGISTQLSKAAEAYETTEDSVQSAFKPA